MELLQVKSHILDVYQFIDSEKLVNQEHYVKTEPIGNLGNSLLNQTTDIEDSKIFVQQFIGVNGEAWQKEDLAKTWNIHSIKSEENLDLVTQNELQDTSSKLEAENDEGEQREGISYISKNAGRNNSILHSAEYYLQSLKNSDHLRIGIYKCSSCDYSFSKKYDLNKHQHSIHLKERCHKCHLCDFTASRKIFLQRHINSVHLNVKNFKCHLCDHTSSQKNHLESHINSVHLKLKNHECQFCDFSASQKNNLRNHIASVHMKVKNQECEHCDYSTSHKGTLMRHIGSIHSKRGGKK